MDYIVHGIAKSRTRLSNFTSLHCLYYAGNSISRGGLLGIPKATLSLNYLLEGSPRFRKAVIFTVIDWYWHIHTTDTMYIIDN